MISRQLREPNIYGWIGIILFGVVSIEARSPWPILIFLLINLVVGCLGLAVKAVLRR